MTKSLRLFMFGVALLAPIALSADDKVVVIQDGRHHDTHEWNKDEDTRYRAYLEERHMKYREFNRLNRKDQDSYWDWRHSH